MMARARLPGVLVGLGALVVVILCSPVLGQTEAPDSEALGTQLEPLCIVGSGARFSRFQVEVADEPHERARGLMFRRKMAPDYGMLFVYSRPRVLTMWMKNTYLSLDMVFIESRGRVLRIESNTTPLSERTISSGGPSVAVLELVAGTAARRGLKPGDRVLHPFYSTQCPAPVPSSAPKVGG